jgi:hypothetical protein
MRNTRTFARNPQGLSGVKAIFQKTFNPQHSTLNVEGVRGQWSKVKKKSAWTKRPGTQKANRMSPEMLYGAGNKLR